jgi:hypothetical protein
VLFQSASFPARLQKTKKPEIRRKNNPADFPECGAIQTSDPLMNKLAGQFLAYVPQRLGVLGAHVLDIILIEVTLSVCTLDVLAVVEPLEVAEPAVPVAPSGVVPLICTV